MVPTRYGTWLWGSSMGIRIAVPDHLADSEQYEQAKKVLDRVLAVNSRHPLAWAFHAVLANLEGNAAEEELWRGVALRSWRKNPAVDHLIGRKLSRKYRFTEGAAAERGGKPIGPPAI